MADPKGPESGKSPQGGHSARPRSPTLDLSAKEVKDKAAAETSAAGAASSSAAAAQAGPAQPAKPVQDAAGPTTSSPKATVDDAPSRSAAKPEPEPFIPPPAAEPPRAEGVGLLGMLAAAVAGAALAVLVVAAFGKHLIRAPEPDMSRVAATESKLDSLSTDIAALRDQVAKLAQASNVGAIEKRLGEVQKSVDGSNGRVEGVEKQVTALAEKAAKPGVDPAAIGMLAGRIDGVDLRLQTLPSGKALEALQGRVADAEAKVKDAPTAQQMATLAARIGAMNGLVEQATKPLGDRLSAIETAVKARPAGDPAARQVVALGALEQALDAGRPFAAELAAVKASSQNGELAALAPYASAGVPTRAALSAELGAIVATLPPEKAAAPEGSAFERLIASAGAVVKITPKGAAQAAAPGAGRDRVAQLASDGDLEQAIAAREGLDDADQSATEDWAKKAAARIAADKALAGARTAALSRLAATD